ncbi:hypothetical protein FBR02_09580 [Anaerolineae bacterium CFX9]|nr:hypothetical protein [Anaerolineae bacterium CFX9]
MLNRQRMLISSALILAGILVFALVQFSASAQQTPAGATPTSVFDFNIAPTTDFNPATATAPPALSGVYGRAERAPVSIRSGPGLEYPRIGFLRLGASIDIIGYNGYDLNRPCSANFEADLDMWVYVDLNGLRGWMARCALTIGGERNMANFIINTGPPGSNPPPGAPTRTPIFGTPTPFTVYDGFGTRYVIPPTPGS